MMLLFPFKCYFTKTTTTRAGETNELM